MKTLLEIQQTLEINSKHFKLAKFKPNLFVTKKDLLPFADDSSDADFQEIYNLQNKLFVENTQSLLIIFQGMDSAGKDGAIKHIMKGLNPQGVLVTSFKHPSMTELEHDYLWRHTLKLPEHGQIAIFNRSHYESVLITKVHPKLLLSESPYDCSKIKMVNKSFWKIRYCQISNFEKRNIENGTHILKFFLNISKNEQGSRFLERITNEKKHWKFSSHDIEERRYWKSYQTAYEQAIKHTSTKTAPWFIIPADDKSMAHILIRKILLRKLRSIKPDYPKKTKAEKQYMQDAKLQLLKELKT